MCLCISKASSLSAVFWDLQVCRVFLQCLPSLSLPGWCCCSTLSSGRYSGSLFSPPRLIIWFLASLNSIYWLLPEQLQGQCVLPQSPNHTMWDRLVAVGMEMSGSALNENLFPGQGWVELTKTCLLWDHGVWFSSTVALKLLDNVFLSLFLRSFFDF